MPSRRNYSKGNEMQPFNELVDERCEPFEGNVQVDGKGGGKLRHVSVEKCDTQLINNRPI